MTTNTNDTALIEAIENLPDHPMAYLVLQAPLHELDAGFRVDSLKSLVSRLQEAEAVIDAAKYIQFRDEDIWLEQKPNGLGWRAYRGSITLGGVSIGEHHPDALSAYRSLTKGESKDG